jgi:hypothetical protein
VWGEVGAARVPGLLRFRVVVVVVVEQELWVEGMVGMVVLCERSEKLLNHSRY